jgi:hypothetical protein
MIASSFKQGSTLAITCREAWIIGGVWGSGMCEQPMFTQQITSTLKFSTESTGNSTRLPGQPSLPEEAMKFGRILGIHHNLHILG